MLNPRCAMALYAEQKAHARRWNANARVSSDSGPISNLATTYYWNMHLLSIGYWRASRGMPKMFCTVVYTTLHCIVLYCVVLYCTVLYCIVLYCTVLYCIVSCCIVLYCVVLYHCCTVAKPGLFTAGTYESWSSSTHAHCAPLCGYVGKIVSRTKKF